MTTFKQKLIAKWRTPIEQCAGLSSAWPRKEKSSYLRKFGDPLADPSRKLAFAGYSALTDATGSLRRYTGKGESPHYQEPIAGETQQQGIRRRQVNPVKWTEHQLGPGSSWVNLDTNERESTLGPDYEQALDEIIEAEMLDHHDQSTDSKQNIEEFLSVEESLRSDYWEQLRKADTYLKIYRRQQDMHPVNWSLETPANVRAMLGLDAGKARYPRTLKKRQEIAIWHFQNAKNKGDNVKDALTFPGDLAMVQRLFKTKPEHSGDNHPLEVNQVRRQANPTPRSPAAQAALDQYEKTGKIILPDHPAPTGIQRKPCTWDPNNFSSIPCECDASLDVESTQPIVENKNRFKTGNDPLRDESLFGYCDDIVHRAKKYFEVENNPNATQQEKAAAFDNYINGDNKCRDSYTNNAGGPPKVKNLGASKNFKKD